MRDDIDDVAKILELRDRVEMLCTGMGMTVVTVSLTDTIARLTAHSPSRELAIEIRLQHRRDHP